jgi:hypothetical protein
MAWGSTYKTNLQKVQTKQNHVIRLIFFATLYGKDTASAKPLMDLFDILTVHNVYLLHVLKFMHLWHNGMLPSIFDTMFKYAGNIHGYNTYSTYVPVSGKPCTPSLAQYPGIAGNYWGTTRGLIKLILYDTVRVHGFRLIL